MHVHGLGQRLLVLASGLIRTLGLPHFDRTEQSDPLRHLSVIVLCNILLPGSHATPVLAPVQFEVVTNGFIEMFAGELARLDFVCGCEVLGERTELQTTECGGGRDNAPVGLLGRGGACH